MDYCGGSFGGKVDPVAVMVDALATIVAALVVRGIGMLTLFVSRGVLGPELSGVWALVQMMLGYSLVAHSGVVTGAEREIPFWRGKKEWDKENRIRQQMFSSALLEGTAVAGLFLLFFALFGHRTRGDLRLGLWFVPLYVILMRLSECWIISWRTIQQFVVLARAQVVFAFIDLTLVFFLVFPYKLSGQYLAFGLGLLARVLIFNHLTNRFAFYTLQWQFRWSHVHSLFRVGFPLVINNLLWVAVASTDSLLVAKKLGVTALGYYTMGVAASRAAGEIPVALSTVLYSHLMGGFGSNENEKELGRKVVSYLKVSVFLVGPLVLSGVYFGIPFILRQFLPKFIPAIGPLRVLVLSGLFLPLANIPTQVFIALKKTLWVSVGTFAMCLLSMGSVWVAAAGGLMSVAFVAAIVQMIFFSALTLMALEHTLGKREAFRTYAVLMAGMGGTVAVILLIDRVLPHPVSMGLKPDLLRSSLGGVSSWVCAGMIFWKMNKEMDIPQRLMRMIRR